MAPHGAKLQIVEDPSLSGTVATDSLVMKVPSAAEAAAWYERWFGAKVVRRGQTTYAEIPGMNIEFSETKEPAVSTRGRALDHIGFEVRNLEAFMRKLSDGGVNVVRQFGPAAAPYSPTLKGQANVLDPWGTISSCSRALPTSSSGPRGAQTRQSSVSGSHS
jgi:catechol 2,3-dioxygenase-like lactoylglutathione lyase family enzyme